MDSHYVLLGPEDQQLPVDPSSPGRDELILEGDMFIDINKLDINLKRIITAGPGSPFFPGGPYKIKSNFT